MVVPTSHQPPCRSTLPSYLGMPSALMKILPPTTKGILGSSTSLHRPLFEPRSDPIRPPEEMLVS
ncbi:hypothetical protein A2U01_0104029, partial [Trifolium medium]|nr:hypothetical protein [Trifolium medium]